MLQQLLEGKIDFEGQKSVESVMRIALAAITAVSFILGFATQSLFNTLTFFSGSTLLLAAILIPPWPLWNRHPVQWLPVKTKQD